MLACVGFFPRVRRKVDGVDIAATLDPVTHHISDVFADYFVLFCRKLRHERLLTEPLKRLEFRALQGKNTNMKLSKARPDFSGKLYWSAHSAVIQ